MGMSRRAVCHGSRDRVQLLVLVEMGSCGSMSQVGGGALGMRAGERVAGRADDGCVDCRAWDAAIGHRVH